MIDQERLNARARHTIALTMGQLLIDKIEATCAADELTEALASVQAEASAKIAELEAELAARLAASQDNEATPAKEA